MRANNESTDWTTSTIAWRSNTEDRGADQLLLTDYGDLIIENASISTLFNSNSDNDGVSPFDLSVSDDGIAYIKDAFSQIIWATHSEYYGNVIWYDTFDSIEGWSGTNSYEVPLTSVECPSYYFDKDTICAVVHAKDGSSWIETSLSVSAYQRSAFQFVVDIYGWDLGDGDYCEIYYRYDDDAFTQHDEQWLDGTHLQQRIDVPAKSSLFSTLSIRLAVVGDSSQKRDICYYDNIALRVISNATVTAYADDNGNMSGMYFIYVQYLRVCIVRLYMQSLMIMDSRSHKLHIHKELLIP